MKYGRVLWDNLLARASGVEWDGDDIENLSYENAYDYSDFTLFATTIGDTNYLTFNTTPENDIDTIAIYIVPFIASDVLPDEAIIGYSFIGSALIAQPTANGVCTVTLQKETGEGTDVWTDVVSKVFSGRDYIWYETFAAVSVPDARRMRIKFENTAGSQLIVRQIALGEGLVFPIGQYDQVTPPSLVSNVVITNPVSQNGSLLTRQSRRLEKTAEIDLQYLTRTWVSDSWNPFAVHAAKKPFFYSWNHEDFPDDACWATAGEIIAPAYMQPPTKMRVSMPLRCLT